MMREKILNYVKNEYNTDSEHLWAAYPSYEVLRHNQKNAEEKGKWYAVIMNVRKESLGIREEGFIDILDVKLEPELVSFMISQPGYRPAYHMNKKYWLTILLDGTVPFEKICQLLHESYALTDGKKQNERNISKTVGNRFLHR